MATESTKDGFITGSQDELNKISVIESPVGVTVLPDSPVKGLKVIVRGKQTWSGARVSGSTFLFSSASLSNTLFTPENKLDLKAKSTQNKFIGSVGEDSIAFGKKTRKDTVKLGKRDGAADMVHVENVKKARDLKIKNFGQEDTLKVGKKSFDYDQLQDKSFKNITIKFD